MQEWGLERVLAAGSDMLSFEIVHLSRAEILKTKQELLGGEQLVEATIQTNNRFTASS